MDPESGVLISRLRYPEGVAGASGFTHSNVSIAHTLLIFKTLFSRYSLG
jgi:hypothetical protein